ncbi:MAG: DNA mismatch repair endonuclease MutL [Clostridiales bacterium]|nr:DNA mismatch repair endonuclease MutL [Clostridiales bacterium]
MNKIKCLSPHVADMIAAGEVVERPGSVVKELVENALDAGASSITVEIQRGGMSYIRVTDNGSGMSPEDAQTAFQRHATSKLRDEYGLESIATLGFRGEALAAISAVAMVELMTREKGAEEGTSVTLEAGVIKEVSPVGCPEGTTMIVRSLFYNTPARLKFMKKDSSEAANVGNVVIRCAMSHPEVAVRYIRDGEEDFSTPGDGSVESCIYSLLGREYAKNMLPVDGSGEGGKVRGFICTPANAKGNRSGQFFFVNGRFIKSALLQAALEQAYKNSLFTGRFPSCVLYIDIKLNEVDVNVHPAKTEVKFLNERKVFDTVYLAVQSALKRESEAPEIKLAEAKKEEPKPAAPETIREPIIHRVDEDREDDVTLRQPTVRYNAPQPRRQMITHRVPLPDIIAPPHETGIPTKRQAVAAARREGLLPTEPPRAKPQPVAEEPKPEPKPVAAERESFAQVELEAPQKSILPEYRILGESFNEFIIVECGGELVFIDKHAAHERMLFDRLKSKKYENMSQMLLVPVIADMEREEKELLLDNKPLLDELGFEIEDFGGSSLAVRRLPADVDMEDAAALLEELCRDIKYGARPGSLGVKDELLATVACKAAIKAGKSSDPMEWRPVVEAVIAGEVRYCPHGRPVTMRLSKSQLEKNFKRT